MLLRSLRLPTFATLSLYGQSSRERAMKLVYDVISGEAEEPEIRSASASLKLQPPATISGYREDGTDRGAMIVAFSRHFPGLSVKALGQLFDKYRITGRIDVHWDAEAGQYDILSGVRSR